MALPSPGDTYAGWRIERPLGQGGLASVYLARDAAGTPAALKLIALEGPEAPHVAAAFEREVAASRRLDHPDIVRILAAGRLGGLGHIAMEFVPGGDLGRELRPGVPMALPRAVGIATRVAGALAHAHAMGIVHRDLKPANILLDDTTGAVKLADFGLARLSDLQRSRTGVLAGTPAYMSPEQLSEAGIDARSDLYSLGVVLFEMLCGQLPYEASSLGRLLRSVSSQAAPPLATRRPEAPAALGELLAALLAKDRAARLKDAAEVARRLLELQTVPGP